MSTRTIHPFSTGAGQRGASLLFALLTLAAMSLAAVALVRSVDTAALLAGNLGHKQSSVAVSGRAAEEAIRQLIQLRGSSSTALDAEQTGVGYYPIAYENLDATGSSALTTRSVVDWKGLNACADYPVGTWSKCLNARPFTDAAADRMSQQASYVITRLCTAAAAPGVGNRCAKPINSTVVEEPNTGTLSYPSGRKTITIDPGPYYRIVVRVTGTRNTVSYAETIVHF